MNPLGQAKQLAVIVAPGNELRAYRQAMRTLEDRYRHGRDMQHSPDRA